MKYYRRYMGDYARDTAHLNLLEHGAYTLLLDYCYARETATLPDLDHCYQICRATSEPERKAVAYVISEFWPMKRLKEEIARGIAAIEIMRESGRQGGVTRAMNAGQNLSLPLRVPLRVPSRVVQDPPSSILTEKEEDPPLAPPRGNGSIDYPPWLDREAWEEFKAHRREIRQPLTSRSERMAIRQLDKLRQQEPQREIIERTIANRWRGFFPARGNGSIEANGPIAMARRMIEERERAEQNSGRVVGCARVDWDAAE